MAQRRELPTVKGHPLPSVGRSGMCRPLVLVLGAVCLCNLLAFTFFFDLSSVLPHSRSLPTPGRKGHLAHEPARDNLDPGQQQPGEPIQQPWQQQQQQQGQEQQAWRQQQDTDSHYSRHAQAAPGEPASSGAEAHADSVQPLDAGGSSAAAAQGSTGQRQGGGIDTGSLSGSHLSHRWVPVPSHGSDADSATGSEVGGGLAEPHDHQASQDAVAPLPQRNEAVISQHLQAATRKWRKHLDMLAGRAVAISNPVDTGPPRVLPVPEIAAQQTDWPVWWFAPFFDHTSFGKEAATLVLGMMRSGAVKEQDIWIGTTQGDCRYKRDESMPVDDFNQLDAGNRRWNATHSAIVVCHSLPPFWARPKNRWATCFPCPPIGYTPAVTIGRAMAETDIYHAEFVKYCNRMDEVWVPSRFSQDTLIKSGVDARKVRVVPIAVNTTWFNPEGANPLELPMGELVFGQHKRRPAMTPAVSPAPQAAGSPSPGVAAASQGEEEEAGGARFRSRRMQPLTATSNDVTSDSANGPSSSSSSGSTAGVGVQDAGAAVADDADPERKLLHASEAAAGAGAAGGAKRKLLQSSEDTGGHLGGSGWRTLRGMPERLGQLLGAPKKKPFVLLSCFKWEMRKGWDVLLAAYLQEFSVKDNVELYILTKPFMAGSNFKGDMQAWVAHHLNLSHETHAKLPTLYVISHHITDMEYVGLLKASNAFVIATRGEGWGMPISEAMSMGLPVVVTGWSGVTDFVDESVGYMVDYNLSQVPNDQPWWFRGARWADASVDSLRKRLREVVSDHDEAARRGQAARERMVSMYSPEALAATLAKEFDRLKGQLRSGHCGDKCHNKTWVAAPGDLKPNLYTGKEDFIVRGLDEVPKDPAHTLSNLAGVNLQSMGDDGGRQRADAWKQIIANINPQIQRQGNDYRPGQE